MLATIMGKYYKPRAIGNDKTILRWVLNIGPTDYAQFDPDQRKIKVQ